jgi:hypothetical protein
MKSPKEEERYFGGIFYIIARGIELITSTSSGF